MERTTLIKLAGVGVGLIVLIMILSWIFDDSLQPTFQETLIAQNTAVELSSAAASDANTPDTRALAARIASTTGSDRSNLLEFYEAEYGASVDAVDETVIEELNTTPEGYDSLYREAVGEQLRRSQRGMTALQRSFTNEEFNAIINKAQSNHEAHIQTLAQD